MEYAALSSVYDALVGADYPAMHKQILAIWDRFGAKPKLVLDLGCGTGSLLALFCGTHEVIGTDISPEMLAEAREKLPSGTLLLLQDMRELDLYGTVDAALCTLDGLNALPDAKGVLETLRRVNLFLSAGGLFIFDINTPHKYRYVLDGATFVYDEPEAYCVWQSDYDKEARRCRFLLDLFVPRADGSYHRQGEELWQQSYSMAQMRRLIERSGLEFVAVYGESNLREPVPSEQRWTFVTRKGKDAPNQG